MFGFIKQVFATILSFSRSLANMVVASDHLSLSNEPCIARLTFIGLNLDEYYPFMVNLDTCNVSCNTVDDPSARICVPNKTKNVNLFLIC